MLRIGLPLPTFGGPDGETHERFRQIHSEAEFGTAKDSLSRTPSTGKDGGALYRGRPRRPEAQLFRSQACSTITALTEIPHETSSIPWSDGGWDGGCRNRQAGACAVDA